MSGSFLWKINGPEDFEKVSAFLNFSRTQVFFNLIHVSKDLENISKRFRRYRKELILFCQCSYIATLRNSIFSSTNSHSLTEEMQITTMLLLALSFILFLNPFVFSTPTPHFSHHPRLTNASDQHALLAFKSAITYDPYQSLATWKPNVSFCHWTGIICSRRRKRVVSLNVTSMGLQGTISPLLANLSFLTILSLLNNSFHGPIPYQLGTLFRLKMLRLSRNQLQGSIPPTLSSCHSLRNLTLSFNNLTGFIPPQLCVLPNLVFMSFWSNNLMGTIPNCLGNISTLQYLYLGYNTLAVFPPNWVC